MITLWSVFAAAVAVGLEYTYRTMPAPWTHWFHLTLFVLLQTVVGICIYKIVTTPNTSLIGAFVVWSAASVGLRIVVSLYLKDAITPGVWAAFALLVLARVLQHFWR